VETVAYHAQIIIITIERRKKMKHAVKRILIFSIIILFTLPASFAFSVQSIKMDRAKLEPPTGMKIYEFQAELLDLGPINNLAAQKGLDLKAMRTRTPRGEVDMFAERDSKVNRLFINQNTGHINLVPHIEKLAKTSPRLLEQGAAFNQAVNHAKALKLVPTDVSQFTPNKLLTLTLIRR